MDVEVVGVVAVRVRAMAMPSGHVVVWWCGVVWCGDVLSSAGVVVLCCVVLCCVVLCCAVLRCVVLCCAVLSPPVLTHDAVPCGVVLLVELLLDVSGDVLLNAVLAEGSGGHIHSLLLHLLTHVSVLDHGTAQVTHGGGGEREGRQRKKGGEER